MPAVINKKDENTNSNFTLVNNLNPAELFSYFHTCISSHQRCSIKKVFLKILPNSQENTCARAFFLIKLQACYFIKKETLTLVLSYEFCQFFKNTFLTERPETTASAGDKNHVVDCLMM